MESLRIQVSGNLVESPLGFHWSAFAGYVH